MPSAASALGWKFLSIRHHSCLTTNGDRRERLKEKQGDLWVNERRRRETKRAPNERPAPNHWGNVRGCLDLIGKDGGTNRSMFSKQRKPDQSQHKRRQTLKRQQWDANNNLMACLQTGRWIKHSNASEKASSRGVDSIKSADELFRTSYVKFVWGYLILECLKKVSFESFVRYTYSNIYKSLKSVLAKFRDHQT